MKLRIKNTSLSLKIISWVQIIGGITGLYLVCKLLVQTGEINGPLLLIFLIGLSLFIFSLYTGIRLLRDGDKKTGIILSILNQILQLFQWSLFGYGLSYSSGAEVLIGFKGLAIDFNFSAIVSSFNMLINSSDQYYLKLNILAILVMIMLFDILKEKQQTGIQNLDPLMGELEVQPLTEASRNSG